MKKRWLSFVVTCCMAVSALFPSVEALAAEVTTAEAQESETMAASQESQWDTAISPLVREQSRGDLWSMQSEESEFPTGRVPYKEVEVELDKLDADELYDSSELARYSSLRSSAIYSTEWDKYRTWYFYNQLTDSEREFYDALDAVCARLLRTTKTPEVRQDSYGKTFYATEYVTHSTLDEEQMKRILLIFRFSNPQYYFLESAWLRGSNGIFDYFAFVIYPAFANGNKRMMATAAVKAQADVWEAQAASLGSEAEKAKLLHDLIIDKVEYNYAILDDNFDEESEYTQSSYSVFCTDKTVCAGYSQAYAMMCNAVGVDTVAVTSLTHEWNKVRIDDSWYNVDLTWDDGVPDRYRFFWRSDYYYDTETAGQSYIHHQEEWLWDGVLPPCSVDSVQTGNYTVPGTLPAVTQTAAVPTVGVSLSGKTYKITLSSATPGAEIYYTLDGSLPTPASTKSHRYQGVVKTNTTPRLRFIAVRDGMWDSADKQVAMVTYYGNQSTSGSMAPTVVSVGDTVSISSNIYKRSGNTFLEWNTKADGTGISYAAGQTVTLNGNLNLYAQWFTGKYRIAYELNGGKNNSKNPSGYTPGKKITLKNPTKKGYTFVGWYTNKKLTKKFTQITAKTKGTLNLYAKWKPIKYKVSYQLGGGKNSGKNPKTYTIATKTIKLKNPTRKGYKFVGWYTNKKFTKKITRIKKGSTGNLTLYAKWKKA